MAQLILGDAALNDTVELALWRNARLKGVGGK
jgi:hypothetical protein